jgi:hypothetical protein
LISDSLDSALTLVGSCFPLNVGPLIGASIAILVNVFLLQGTRTRNPTYVLVYLIFTLIEVVLLIISGVGLIVHVIKNIDHNETVKVPLDPIEWGPNSYRYVENPNGRSLALAAIYGVIAAIHVYFWILVFSFYKLINGDGVGAGEEMTKAADVLRADDELSAAHAIHAGASEV